VGVDGLEQPQNNPDVHGKNVQVLGEVAVEEGAADGTGTEDEHFRRVGIFSSKAERRRVLVVDLVDVLVQDTGVESLVSCEWRQNKINKKNMGMGTGENLPRKWKKSSKKKKKKICGAIVLREGKGT
jgi:hypothetical protein